MLYKHCGRAKDETSAGYKLLGFKHKTGEQVDTHSWAGKKNKGSGKQHGSGLVLAHHSPTTIKERSLEQHAWKSFCSSTPGEHKQSSKIP